MTTSSVISNINLSKRNAKRNESPYSFQPLKYALINPFKPVQSTFLKTGVFVVGILLLGVIITVLSWAYLMVIPVVVPLAFAIWVPVFWIVRHRKKTEEQKIHALS